MLSKILMGKLIEIENISMNWENRTTLENINLTVSKGDFIAITGPNGGGKTTLMKIILKLLNPTTGKVSYYIDDSTKRFPRIGYLPQKNMIDNRFPITLREMVESGLLGCYGYSKNKKKAMVADILKLIELEEHAEKAIGELSGGQLQRGLLGRAIISSPEILVLDEPLSYVDKKFEKKIYSIIEHIAKNATILLVSHEMSTISTMANRHLIIDKTVHECSAEHHYIRTECDDII